MRLTQDIDLSGINFEPIGTRTAAATGKTPFSGTFDGQGHSIKNLTVYTDNGETQVRQWHALFGACSNATIQDLTIDGCDITSNSMMGSSVCVLCPDVENSSIDNVTLTGQLSCGAGMVLRATASTFTNCTLDYTQSSLASGIVSQATNGCTISKCTVRGTLDASASKGSGIGAMAGTLTNSSVTNCSSSAEFIGRMNDAGYMGSMVGHAVNSTISDCVNTGKVTLTNRSTLNNMEPVGGYAGSIAGFLENSRVERCINRGEIFNESVYQGREADPQEEFPAGAACHRLPSPAP